jgi:hypothetical protein
MIRRVLGFWGAPRGGFEHRKLSSDPDLLLKMMTAGVQQK